ncbi:hypothetical protein NOS3756_57670 (plasmid) [Nostoc sp. NIES-3756]|uniref:DUF6753 family protein n=1 Tax=Nostoc sp. NIES-3756 TaxID=1751286 RepID=UPI00072285EC|nr:DUF6753 family protein [Nostoc sp. NIES-3756]BAT56755.1 hypothetical protein NOS3756_57670 [Nostoc sp. NIES-3756]
MTISNYTQEDQERIRELADEVGFDPDDPLFQIMTVLGNFEEMMGKFPTQMEALLEAGALMMDKRLSDATRAAEVMQHAVITSAVKESLKEELPKLRPTISLPVEAPQIGKVKLGVWSIGGILGGMIAIGALLGSVTTGNVIANYIGIGNSDVTANDLKLLQWAKSTEGQQARLLAQDNKIELEVCRRDERLLDRCVVKIRKSK